MILVRYFLQKYIGYGEPLVGGKQIHWNSVVTYVLSVANFKWIR